MNKRKWFLVAIIVFNIGYLYYIAAKPNISPEEALTSVKKMNAVEGLAAEVTSAPKWRFVDGQINRVYEVTLEKEKEVSRVLVSVKSGKILSEE